MTESVYDQVHREYMERGQDPTYQLAMGIYLGELVGEIAEYHQAHIQAIADQAAMRQIAKAKSDITKSFLAMRLEEIRKDGKTDFKEGNWVREHGRFARWVGPHEDKQPQYDASGRRHNWGSQAQDYHEVVRDHLNRLPFEQQQKAHNIVGYLARPVELPVDVSDAEHKADVFQRNAELVHDLENKTRDPRNKQRVQFFVTNKNGKSRIITPHAGVVPGQGTQPDEIDWAGGERVQYMTPVGPDHPVMVAGHALNIGHVMGADPEQAAKLGSVAQDIHDTITSTSWGKKLQAAANAARVVSGNHPVAAQAHAVAQLANLIGPDAARAFGPKLRQLTYRYSGQEARPEQYSQVAKDINEGKVGPTVRPRENALAIDLASSLPTQSQYKASLQAGSTPPSRGFILNKDGKVVSEAVGFSDDWYAPFNLRKLPQMRGGSYVRSRAYGGLTPEDLRLAMRTGATRATVVSNNGTFTMEFDPKALHWGHRFGFAGNAMIRRYAKSLDAIKNNKVDDPTAGPGQKLSLNSRGYQAAMHDLVMKYPYWIANPTTTGVPFHQPGRGPEAQGDHEDKQGYIAPLGTRAQGAQAGWAEPDHRELWSSNPDGGNQGGKYAYDTIDRYRLQQDQVMRVMRALGGASAGTGGTSSASTGTQKSPTTAGSTAANAGAVRTERAYPEQEKLTADQMGGIFGEIKMMMRRAHNEEKHPDLSNLDRASELHDLLMDDSKRGGPEYKRLRDEYAASPDKRAELAEELGDAYNGKDLGSEDLLPRLLTEVNDSDEDQGAAAAAEEQYSAGDIPAFASVDSSPRIKTIMQAAAERAEDPRLSEKEREGHAALHNNLRWYKQRLHEIEAAQRQNRAPRPLSEVEGAVFTQMNEEVKDLLNEERRGPSGDTGERTSTKGKMVAFSNEDYTKMLQPSSDVEDVAQDILADAMASSDDETEQQNYAVDAVGQLHRRASWHRERGQQRQAERLTHVANTLADKAEEMASYQQMQRQLRNPNS